VREKFVAEAAGFLLDVTGRGGKGCGVERQIAGGGQAADECLVGVGVCAAKLVVHVKNGHGRAQFMERRQQENGIRSARDGDPDSLPLADHGCHLVDHTSIL
jgi:hypothetical protein